MLARRWPIWSCKALERYWELHTASGGVQLTIVDGRRKFASYVHQSDPLVVLADPLVVLELKLALTTRRPRPSDPHGSGHEGGGEGLAWRCAQAGLPAKAQTAAEQLRRLIDGGRVIIYASIEVYASIEGLAR